MTALVLAWATAGEILLVVLIGLILIVSVLTAWGKMMEKIGDLKTRVAKLEVKDESKQKAIDGICDLLDSENKP